MAQTPREIVKRCLTFDHPERIPRDLWVLPWAESRYPEIVADFKRIFPNDIIDSEYEYPSRAGIKDDRWKVGYYTDEWGCTFKNIQAGIIGEIETPILTDIADWKKVVPPYVMINENRQAAYDIINRHYANVDKFVLANCFPRPWERYQFLRGSENALIDILVQDRGTIELLRVIHEFYLREFEFWMKSDVDGVWFMDDWGAQTQLLINPDLWRELFKPLYKDYCDLAKAYDKFTLMHSDGYITDIIGDLVEIGIDAINSQLFCMDMSELATVAKGKITFWGEIDRQHIMPSKDPAAGRAAVREVAKHLNDPSGGLIAQLEFGLGANPATVAAILEEWNKVSRGGL